VTKRSRKEPELRIYVDDRPDRNIALLSAEGGTGARPMQASFVVRDPASGVASTFKRAASLDRKWGRLADFYGNKFVEVVVFNETGRDWIHGGRVCVKEWSAKPDQVILTSRMDPYLWSKVTIKRAEVQHVYAVKSDTWKVPLATWSHSPMVFNPTVAGAPTPNMARVKARQPDKETVDTGVVREDFYRFVDLDAVQREQLIADRQAEETRDSEKDKPKGEVVTWWTLTEAVLHLCNVLSNTDYVKLPKRADVEKVLGKDPTLLRDVGVASNAYLADVLDDLLRPYGFGYALVKKSRGKDGHELVFFDRGSGRGESLILGPKSEGFDSLYETDFEVADATVAIDISATSFNRVYGYGERDTFESSFILRPEWDDDYDETAPSELTKKAIDELDPGDEKRDAWRKWVCNEGGDYTDERWFQRADDCVAKNLPKRDEDGNITGADDDTDRTQFSNLDEPKKKKTNSTKPKTKQEPWRAKWNYVRRQFGKLISSNEDGTAHGYHGGVYVEFLKITTSSGETTEAWAPLDEAGDASQISFRLLDDEMGLMFAGDQVPKVLWQQGKTHGVKKQFIRLTATVEADNQTTHKDLPAYQPKKTKHKGWLEDWKDLIIEGAWTRREITKHSKYHADGTDDPMETDQREQIVEACQSMVRRMNVADCTGTIIWN